MHHAYETCLRLIFPDGAVRKRDCSAVFHSDIDAQLGAYEFTIQQSLHSILAHFDHSLEDPCRDDVPVDP